MPVPTLLSAAEKAAVLNYVSSLSVRCKAPAEPFTANEVDSALNDSKWNSTTLHRLRDDLFRAPAAAETTGQRSNMSDSAVARAAEDFTLFCQGCHQPHGEGVPGHVPTLRDSVSLFLRTGEGRAFLARVPGVAFAPLDDDRLANLLTWVVRSFGGAGVPASFAPFRSAEVGADRKRPFVDVEAARREILVKLSATADHTSP
jgi:hypothetical protein